MRKTLALLLATAFVATLPSLASAKTKRRHAPVVMQPVDSNEAGPRLVGNALRYCSGGSGSITLSVRDSGFGSRVELHVADDGPGIGAEDVAHIFEPFFTTRSAGTGLGLTLSRKLIELHGGRLWVESEVGEGSTFRFTLPVRQPAMSE